MLSQILEIARGSGIKKTNIMSKASFLSHHQLNQYLKVLTENDLLHYDLGTQTFKTTEKGLRFLHTRNQIDAMIRVQQTYAQL